MSGEEGRAGAQVSQETGGKGDKLMGERETDNSLPGDKTTGQNMIGKDPTEELFCGR